jgi:hypothetical protein
VIALFAVLLHRLLGYARLRKKMIDPSVS